ncbi:histidine kinase [Glaciihabitans tibetensis]|uniref:histidine kinase n=1 Tax=Glaciihabitans tibetensis TaxID=1266600 RepID=A0A2T0VJ55_9MICO|nr:histidine kinase [Glaciihabitans tibetensis]PRY70254.1 histidine kinase [Glaciihabitans tibetensis]
MSWLETLPADALGVFAVASAVLLLTTVVLLVAWLRSRYLRRVEQLDRHDTQLDVRDLELALAEQTARLRMIRELHDVAIHSMSVRISQAESVRYSAESDPGTALRSAAAIETAARSTLADLRRVMTVVGDGDADLDGPTRLEAATQLFAEMRKAGLTIVVSESGERFALVPGAELAVLRILKVSLDNALEHGGEGTEVAVSLNWSGEGLRVQVDDDGTRATARRAGLDPNRIARERTYSVDDDLNALTEEITGAGITEMRERATLFGGVFNAYSVPGVGFSVSAVFPALRFHNGVHGVNLDA